jgi:hypothetical protein
MRLNMNSLCSRWVGSTLCLAMLVGSAAQADAPKTKTSAVAEASAEKEIEALKFAKEHHPELADLLTNLKKSNRGAYDKGIQHLHRDSERLTRSKQNNPGRYEFEIELWKTESRIRLTAARSMMDDSADSLKAELRDLIAHREQTKLKMLRFSRDRLTSQVSKIDADIAAAEVDQEKRIDQEVERLLKAPKKRDVKVVQATGKKPIEKPAKKPDSTEPEKLEGQPKDAPAKPKTP